MTTSPDDSEVTLVYRWLSQLTPSACIAEDLTIDVFRRLGRGEPRWLSTKPRELQLRFYIAQAALQQRGVLRGSV